jgi:hypothetical protein
MSRFEPLTYHPTCTVVRTAPRVLHASGIGRGEVVKTPPRFEPETLFLKATMSKPSPRFDPETFILKSTAARPALLNPSLHICAAALILHTQGPRRVADDKEAQEEGKGGKKKRRDERKDPRRTGPIVPVSEAEKDLNKRFSKPQTTEGGALSKNTRMLLLRDLNPRL